MPYVELFTLVGVLITGTVLGLMEIPSSVSRSEFRSQKFLGDFAAWREIISAALANLALARIARYRLKDGLPNTYLVQSRQVAKLVILNEVKEFSNQSVDLTPTLLSRQLP